MTLQANLTTAFTAVATSVKGLRVMITGSSSGTLASLSTTDKSSIIAAINEVVTTAGAAVTSVNGVAGPGAITITTANVSEVTNLYFTNARAIAAPLTGYSASAGVIAATDSVLVGIQKLAGNLAGLVTTNVAEGTNLYYTNARGIGSTLTGYVSGAGTVAAADTVLSAIQKLNGNIVGLSTTNVAEGSNLYFTNARGIGAVLTGYTSSTGTVAATDTVLQAIQKLAGNAAALTTTAVAEGTNLYFTQARAIASPITGYSSAAGTVSAADTIVGAIGKLNGNVAALTTTNVAEGSNLYFTDARVLATALTGYSATTGVVAATDTVLQGIQKLAGNAAALINDTTASTTTVYSSTKTNSQIATAVANLVNSATSTLDTLGEIATALGNDPNLSTTLTTAIGLKANSADVFTKVELGTGILTQDFAADFAAGLL
jgi:hypothetical protein